MTQAQILESVDAVGPRIAALRVLNGLSLEQLAVRSSLTKSYLSKLERGLSQPSIASILKISRAFGVSSGELLKDSVEPDEIAVIRHDQRVPFSRSATHTHDGYAYEAIAAHRANKSMTPFVMRPPLVYAEDLELVDHAGEELVYVISGVMEVMFRDRTITLEAGDAIYFNASTPHRSRSVGNDLAEALVVISTLTARSGSQN